MQRIYNILTSICLLTLSTANAQTDIDALRYSKTTFGGTARGISIGGALGALGADFASFSINPAGLGVNQSSYWAFSPSVNSIKTTSDYIGTSSADYKYNFNFSNFGLVYADASSGNYNWSSINFAFGHNRLANYHHQSFFTGYNPDNSLLDRYVEDANGNTSPENFYDNFPFGAGLAWETYLIDPADTSAAWDASQNYLSIIPNGNVTQSRTSRTRGAMDEYVFSIGSGYRDKLYIGGTIGIPYIRYREETTYREEDSENMNAGFNHFTLTDNLSTNGTGVNFKFGLIYRLAEWIRIGGAIHTPTYFAMTDKYSSSMTSSLSDTSGNNVNYSASSPDGSFNYSLTTPWRGIGSLAFVFREVGFVSVDYEYVDYGLAAFHFSTSDPNEKILANSINQIIRSKYGPASNIRIGTEIKKDVMRFRLGYAMYGSPFQSDVASNNKRTTYSGGIGYSDDDVFVDFTYAKTITDEYYAPYTLSASNETIHGAKQTIFQNNFLITFGVKF